jgi:membrane carboxypeptidase/penicillin-binding protein
MPRRLLKIALRLAAVLLCILTLAVAGISYWLLFYTSDLPDAKAMAAFCPNTPTQVAFSDAFGNVTNIVAVPANDYKNVREALLAAEGEFPEHGVYREVIESFNSNPLRAVSGQYSSHIAMGMPATPSRRLGRQLERLRTANQLELHFTQEQLLSIYLNRVYFGTDIFGIEAAAEHYFSKHAADLTVAEAALLAGLISHPSVYKNPDNALKRRNDVLDLMAQRGSLTPAQAEAQKALPLGTTAK